MKNLSALILCGVLADAGTVLAASITVTMNKVNAQGVGDIIGTIVFQDSAKGLKIMPNLKGLSEGQHGFHVHQNPACGPKEKNGKVVPGLAAGGHFDPEKAGKHKGPIGWGHLGDLPVLYVDAAGRAARTSFAPYLKTSNLAGRSIIIHAGGDNDSDYPKKLGGGGARIACGVVVY
jgi:Cu-Zn family superoxide dismutase